MASSFPGMNPYLESKERWRSFYHHLASEVAVTLNQVLHTSYYADIAIHSITDGEEALKLYAVHIYTSETKELVTTIELLSPASKRGRGLDQYREKRRRILLSAVHFVEIDLLRGGEHPGWEVNDPPIDTDYILLVNRYNTPHRNSEIWDVAINIPLPTLPIPLLPPDPDVPLNMQTVVET
ncbi:MAG: DUF4058 family protein, partial [Caldilineaceae bacterium]|nr:DUF4058 family protein [Caldilineaceae bacterium]